jgi:hypothetical protein
VSNCHNKLADHFEEQQLAAVECAFEMRDDLGDFRDTLDNDPVTLDRAIAFGKRHRSDRSRLIAILKNIIANDGEFVP